MRASRILSSLRNLVHSGRVGRKLGMEYYFFKTGGLVRAEGKSSDVNVFLFCCFGSAPHIKRTANSETVGGKIGGCDDPSCSYREVIRSVYKELRRGARLEIDYVSILRRRKEIVELAAKQGPTLRNIISVRTP